MKSFRLIFCLLSCVLSNALMAQWSLFSTLAFTLSVTDTAKTCNVITGHGSNIYAGTTKGLLMSSNNGLTWTNLTRGNATTMAHDTVMCISFVTNGSTNLLMIGTRSKIYASADNGLTWTDKSTGLIPNSCMKAIVQSGSRLIAAAQTSTGGIYTSDNYGNSWDSSNTGLDHKSVNCILVDGSNLYIGEGAGVFMSSNNGTSWTSVSSGLPTNVFVYALAKNGTTLYAGSAAGKAVWKTTNNGTSWDSLNTNLPSFCQVFGIITAKSKVYISESGSTAGSIYWLDESNNSWVADTVGLMGASFFPSIGTNQDESKMYIVSGNGGTVFVKSLGFIGLSSIENHLDFNLFPNPAHSNIQIQSKVFTPATCVTLIDMSGRIVSTRKGESTIDVSETAPGIYFIEVSNSAGSARKLFVKE